MLSRLQIMQQLTELQDYKFVAYFGKLEEGKHMVKLCVKQFLKNSSTQHLSVVNFIVTERSGYLSAVSVSGSIVVERLT